MSWENSISWLFKYLQDIEFNTSVSAATSSFGSDQAKLFDLHLSFAGQVLHKSSNTTAAISVS